MTLWRRFGISETENRTLVTEAGDSAKKFRGNGTAGRLF